MTDDLVKRLRDKVEVSRIYDDDEELLDEAADRIEQLEAALRGIFDGPRDVKKSYAEHFIDACIEARAALAGGKKDD